MSKNTFLTQIAPNDRVRSSKMRVFYFDRCIFRTKFPHTPLAIEIYTSSTATAWLLFVLPAWNNNNVCRAPYMKLEYTAARFRESRNLIKDSDRERRD